MKRIGKREATPGPSLLLILIEAAALIEVLWWIFGR